MGRYTLGQRVQVSGLQDNQQFNGQIVTIRSLPGTDPVILGAYVVVAKCGTVLAVIERFLLPYPPTLPNGRGDTDTPSNWLDFDKATGLKSIVFRRGNADY